MLSPQASIPLSFISTGASDWKKLESCVATRISRVGSLFQDDDYHQFQQVVSRSCLPCSLAKRINGKNTFCYKLPFLPRRAYGSWAGAWREKLSRDVIEKTVLHAITSYVRNLCNWSVLWWRRRILTTIYAGFDRSNIMVEMSSMPSSEVNLKVQDEGRLAELGYTQELTREWSLLHNFGASFSIIVRYTQTG